MFDVAGRSSKRNFLDSLTSNTTFGVDRTIYRHSKLIGRTRSCGPCVNLLLASAPGLLRRNLSGIVLFRRAFAVAVPNMFACINRVKAPARMPSGQPERPLLGSAQGGREGRVDPLDVHREW